MKISHARWLALAGLLALSVGSDCASFETEGTVCTTTHEGEKVCDEHSGSELVIICSADQEWEAYENCLDSDQVCVEIEGVVGEAECVDAACTEGETRCADNEVETCNEQDAWRVTDTCQQDQVCEVVDGDAMCVPGSGGTGGSGGTAGTGGTGGGSGSCFEMDIEGEANIMGPLSISRPNASPDDIVTVLVGVDGDTREVTAVLINEISGFPGGSCVAFTDGNETVVCDLRVETVADPGPHVLEIELRADPSNRLDYILYTPGDGNTYVRIKVENNVPGPQTATPCLELNCDIQF